MIKSLAKFSIACVLALSMGGCAMNTADTDEEALGSNESALRTTYPLYARATFDPNLGKVIVDLATTKIAPIGDVPIGNPHTPDRFINVRVRLVAADGTARIISVLGGTSIGPGGGCIHFNVPANVGDTLAIDSVVRLTTNDQTRVGATAPTEVVVGDWANDPTINMAH